MKQISLFNGEEKDKIEKYLFEIKFGNKFLIMKDKSSNVFLRYIILYEDILQKIPKNIDYILKIKDKNKIEEEVKLILKNKLWNYIQKKSLGDSEYVNVFDKENNLIGYFMRNGDINSLKKLEKENYLKNNKTTIYKSSSNNIFQQNGFNFNCKVISFLIFFFII